MLSDEDSELILEGGELHNYLKSLNSDFSDVYSAGQSANVTQIDEGASSSVLPKLASKEVMEGVNAILNSKLLLEEDAIYLFRTLTELVPQHCSVIPSKVLFPGIIIAVSTYGSLKLWNLRKFWIPVITCSTVILLSGMKDIINRLTRKDSITKLLTNLQMILSQIRKHIKLIQEEDAVISTKQKFLHLRNDENVIDIYIIKQKRVENFVVSKKFIYILKSLIILSRNITLAVFDINKHKSNTLKRVNYIASYSDEQLGINKDCEELDEDTNLLPFIDGLKNIYILIQSETLRALGICLCESTEAQEFSVVFKIINQYTSQSSSILSKLNNHYEKYFYPTNIPKKVNNINSNTRYLSNILNNVSSVLNGLLIDSRKMQDFIDENSECTVTTRNSIGLKLLDMERQMAYLVEYINLSQYLSKKKNYHMENPTVVFPENDKNIIKTGFTVGISDFSVAGPDEVFLGYVEGTERRLLDECNEEYVKPTYHNILMSELKTTLISKREDFEKREINALKSNEEIESYKACKEEYNLSDVTDCNQTNKKTSRLTFHNESTSSSEFREIKSLCYPLNEDVATKAINLFKTWNKETTEECFGDEGDSEHEDS